MVPGSRRNDPQRANSYLRTKMGRCSIKCAAGFCLWIASLLLSSFLVLGFGQENTDGDNLLSRVVRISALIGNVSFLCSGLDQCSLAVFSFCATSVYCIYTD